MFSLLWTTFDTAVVIPVITLLYLLYIERSSSHISFVTHVEGVLETKDIKESHKNNDGCIHQPTSFSFFTPSAIVCTSCPWSSRPGGFSTSTACTNLLLAPSPEGTVCCLEAAEGPAGGEGPAGMDGYCWCCAAAAGGSTEGREGGTGVMWLQTAHFTDCAPWAYINVTWHPPHTRWPNWFYCCASLRVPHKEHWTWRAPLGYMSITLQDGLVQWSCAMSWLTEGGTAVIWEHRAHRTFWAPWKFDCKNHYKIFEILIRMGYIDFKGARFCKQQDFPSPNRNKKYLWEHEQGPAPSTYNLTLTCN